MKFLQVSLMTLLFFYQLVLSQIPQTMSYQGVLTDVGGTPVPDGDYELTFKLYDVESGGTALWNEVQTITITEGIFNVILGTVTSLTLTFDKPYWLGITVGSGTELSPRIQLTSSAYSLNTKTVEDNAITTTKIEDGQVTTDDLQDNAVTIEKIGPNLLSSINNVDNDGGNIDLIAGSNVTILPNNTNKTITISSTGSGGIGGTGTTDYLPRFTGPATLGNSAIFQSGNNIGIGTINPQGLLHVTHYGDKQLILGHDNQPSREWLFEVDATAKMTLNNENAGSPITVMSFDLNDGNVGIGTTSPTEKLEVNGTIHSTADGFKFPDGSIQTTAVSSPTEIYFSVKRNAVYDWPINATVQTVDFVNNSTIWANVGGGFNPSSGWFVAPVAGIYTFHGAVDFRNLTIGDLIYAQIRVGSKHYFGTYKGASRSNETVTVSITTHLDEGDSVTLRGYVSAASPPGQVYGNTNDSYAFTYFSGSRVY